MAARGKKAAATAALLGEPASAASAPAAAASSSSGEPPTKKKKVKKEDGTAGGSGGSVEKRLLSLLSLHPKGVGQEEVCEGLGLQPSDLLDTVNTLLNAHRIELLQDGNGKIFYKVVSADKYEKLRGLLVSEILIYQLVEKSGNQGIWIKDLRRKSNLSALEIPKHLKELMKRKLIKCEKSIQATNKKVYMLYDIEPAREVSGGAWYDKTTGEFDVEFMRALENACMLYLEKKLARRQAERERAQRNLPSGSSVGVPLSSLSESGMAGAAEVCAFLRDTGAFNTLPSESETERILAALALEGRLDRTRDEEAEWRRMEEEDALAAPAELTPSKKRRRDTGSPVYLYRFVPGGAFQSAFGNIPCATCPVAHNCRDGAPVSPQSCEYFNQWLAF